ncbi:muramoyltetrapeptide carboxypeptidase [Nocardiopsis arvandica]|uniref:Muramoyltetrapeptide carboxypeptidase n=1 Tax=Nocardiopsis sinuspersici TaxID=501010 RepID=A0A7Y9XB16_9ACTN|nr:LD-carboxypeptidase [Nocardiopsis sinuspersici]NYH50975.1 muramoyltetrapeptide carboxypeptidase [Nocardiopsis sinuspersici]
MTEVADAAVRAPRPRGVPELVRPPRLRKGDRVRLVAPCSPVPAEQLDAAVEALRGWGLEVEPAPHVRERHPRLPYLAGADATRAADLQAAWCDPNVDAVFCVRGGDGAHRTLDLLDFDAMRGAGPKALIGFSDVTAVHEAFAVELGVATVHGPVVGTRYFVGDAAAQEELRTTLFHPERRVLLTSPGAHALVPGRAEGVTFGGNLSLLNDGLATPHSRLSASGGILLLEDIGEDVARLDRMLTHLLRTGWMDGVAGVALGTWTDCPPDPGMIAALMRDRLEPLGVPVLWGLEFGHCAAQLTVPLGVPALLDADDGSLELAVPGLA